LASSDSRSIYAGIKQQRNKGTKKNFVDLLLRCSEIKPILSGASRIRGFRVARGRATWPARVVEILPKLFMLPQVNDGCRLLAAFIHPEGDSTHGNNLAEK
jgi:hypothetical protein